MAKYLATLGGLFIKLDHSFKAPKRIRDSTGQKQYSAVLTIMNEFCQVRGQHGRWLMPRSTQSIKAM